MIRRALWRLVVRLFGAEVNAVAAVEREACAAFLEATRDRSGLCSPRERALLSNTAIMLRQGKHLPRGVAPAAGRALVADELKRRRMGGGGGS